MVAEYVGEVEWNRALSVVGRNLGMAATVSGALIEVNDGNTTEAVISFGLGVASYAAAIYGLPAVATGLSALGLTYGVYLMFNDQDSACSP